MFFNQKSHVPTEHESTMPTCKGQGMFEKLEVTLHHFVFTSGTWKNTKEVILSVRGNNRLTSTKGTTPETTHPS